MIAFVLLSLPIFGVIALGWSATKARLTTASTVEVLGAFSLRYALPALVLRMIAGQPLASSFNPAFFMGYLASAGLVFASGFWLSRLQRHDIAVAGARAATMTVSNLGFLGPPLMLAFFGERGAAPLALAIVVEVMLFLSLGGALMAVGRGAESGIATLVARGTVLNPVIAAIAVGAALAATGAALPSALDQFLRFLGASAAPTSLFAIGAALGLQSVDSSSTLAAAGMTAAKLVAYPLLAWLVLAHVVEASPFWVQAGVVLAALPSAGSTYVMAQRYAADPERVSAAIVLSTVASAVSVPCAAWLILR